MMAKTTKKAKAKNPADATLRNVRATKKREAAVRHQLAAIALTVVDLAETVRKLDDATTQAFADVKQRLWKVESRTGRIR